MKLYMEAKMSDYRDFQLPDPPPTRGNNAEGKQTPADQQSPVPKGWHATLAKPLPSVQCTGIIRNGERAGERCNKWSIAGATVCLQHGGHLPNVKKAAEERKDAARLQLIGATSDAVDVIEHLMKYATQENVKLAAAKDVLDRAGIKAGMEINVTHEHKLSPMDEINQRLADMAKNLNNDEEKTPQTTENSFTSQLELDIIESEVVAEDVNNQSEDYDSNE
jgi:hypothetical protein